MIVNEDEHLDYERSDESFERSPAWWILNERADYIKLKSETLRNQIRHAEAELKTKGLKLEVFQRELASIEETLRVIN